MFLKNFIKDYLSFSKRDRLGLLALIFLILIIYLLPKFFSREPKALALKESGILKQAIDTLAKRAGKEDEEEKDERQATYPDRQSENLPTELFKFDPNTLPIEGWQRLGLSSKTSKTIGNYRNKGGRFYKAEDLKKIWGLPAGFYERVKNYIVLETDRESKTWENQSKTISNEKTPATPMVLDINSADTAAFISLPGIGSKLASRIVTFREKLGGFYSVEQVAEIYGLADSVFQKIKPRLQVDDLTLRKLNVNTATKEELKVHPYLKWPLANAIVEYRHQHGNYKTLEDLKAVKLMDDATFRRIAPYLIL